MKRNLFIRLICDDRSGATAIEFAVVSGVFFMMMFGIIEYGMIMLTKVAIESATNQVGRSASIGSVATGCADRVCSIKKLIADKTAGLVNPQSVLVTSAVVSNPTTVTPPIADICLDSPTIPYPPTCSKWVNNDGVTGYQQSSGLVAGSIGGAGDLVEIRVTYLWKVFFPIFQSSFGTNGVLTISSSTVVKNEPFN
jgi:hypothetical protein